MTGGVRPNAMPGVPASTDGEVTRLLNALKRGEEHDAQSHDALLTSDYDAHHRIARSQRAEWNGNQTPNATALVHEAYLKLDGSDGGYQSRSHFLAVAS